MLKYRTSRATSLSNRHKMSQTISVPKLALRSTSFFSQLGLVNRVFELNRSWVSYTKSPVKKLQKNADCGVTKTNQFSSQLHTFDSIKNVKCQKGTPYLAEAFSMNMFNSIVPLYVF